MSRWLIATGLALMAAASSTSSFADSTTVSYEEIIGLIQSRQLTTIDQLLPLLPSGYRSHYALAYHSESLQCATPQAPRVIMYGDDAKTVIAFNGSPQECGYHNLEVMQFDDKTKKFEFHEIPFPPPKSFPSDTHVSSAKCVGCHQDHASAGLRPNWMEYKTWPGFYGSYDDDIELSSQTDEYNAFLSHKAGTRYQYLKTPAGAPSTYPYESGLGSTGTLLYRANTRLTLLFNILNTQRQAEILSRPEYSRAIVPYVFATMGCYRDAVTIKNIGKVLGTHSELITSNYYESEGNDLLAGEIVQAVGLSPRDWSMMYKPHQPYPSIDTDDEYYSIGPDQLGPYTYDDALNDGNNFTAKLLANGLAAAHPAFNAVFDPTPESYASYGKDAEGRPFLDASLLSQIYTGGGSLSQSMVLSGSSSNSTNTSSDAATCAVLRKMIQLEANQPSEKNTCTQPDGDVINPKSRQALHLSQSALAQLGDAARRKPSNPTLKYCASCHSSGLDLAPQIPFTDPAALKAALRGNDYPHGTLMDEIKYRLQTKNPSERMPKGTSPGTASDEINAAVLKYLQSL